MCTLLIPPFKVVFVLADFNKNAYSVSCLSIHFLNAILTRNVEETGQNSPNVDKYSGTLRARSFRCPISRNILHACGDNQSIKAGTYEQKLGLTWVTRYLTPLPFTFPTFAFTHQCV